MPTGDQHLDSQADSPTRPSTSVALWAGAVVAVGFAVYFTVSVVIGAIRWTHPIPYWDMWDGHLSFWFELQDGNTAIWWEFSNEHHLLLLKAIFWLNLQFFSGSTAFLIAGNLVLLAVLAGTLIVLSNARATEILGRGRALAGRVIIAAVIVTIVTAWMQGEDLTIGYHAQWILITLLPIALFLFIGLASTRDNRRGLYFGFAVAVSVLVPWAAASGLVAPFVAAVLAYLVGLGIKRFLVFVAIGAVSTVIYAIGHPIITSSSSGSGPISNLSSMPLDVLRFWLLYLGGPWARVTDSQWIGGVAGALFAVIVVGYVIRQLRSSERSVFGLATVAFPVFMLGMAFVTAAGRISFGIEQVTALRYLTPMLSAWACLLILAAPALLRRLEDGASIVLLGLLIPPLLLLPEQEKAWDEPKQLLQSRDTATLAVALNALDPEAITPVYPISPDRPLMLGQRARAEGVGVFADSPYAGLSDQLGTSGSFAPATQCFGWVDSRTPLEGSNLDRIDGWVVPDGQFVNDGVLFLLNAQGTISGFIDVGRERPDVLDEFPDAGGYSGYSGYLDRSVPTAEVFVASDDFRCSNPLTPAVP